MTYQVVGHSKTIVIIYVGSLIFNTPLNWYQFIGVVTALGGTIYYSYLKMNEPKPAATPSPTVKEEVPLVKNGEANITEDKEIKESV